MPKKNHNNSAERQNVRNLFEAILEHSFTPKSLINRALYTTKQRRAYAIETLCQHYYGATVAPEKIRLLQGGNYSAKADAIGLWVREQKQRQALDHHPAVAKLVVDIENPIIRYAAYVLLISGTPSVQRMLLAAPKTNLSATFTAPPPAINPPTTNSAEFAGPLSAINSFASYIWQRLPSLSLPGAMAAETPTKTLSPSQTKLLRAIENGDIHQARNLLQGLDPNYEQSGGASPLHFAAKNNQAEFIRDLLAAGAEINKPVSSNGEFLSGATALFSASERGNLASVNILLKEKADINKATNDGITPLSIASEKNHFEVVTTLIDANAALDQADRDLVTPLYIATEKGHYKVVRKLLESGANPNLARKKDTTTPLHKAVLIGDKTLVEILMPYANWELLTKIYNHTPLDIATHAQKTEIVRLLTSETSRISALRKAVDILAAPNLKWSEERKKDHHNLTKQRIEKMLGEKGKISSTARTQLEEMLGELDILDRRPPLYVAALDGNIELVRKLIADGADVDQANEAGRTPLQIAAREGHTAIVAALLDAKADTNTTTDSGFTPLHIAVYRQKKEVVKLLAPLANLEQKTNTGKTALDLAKESRNAEIIAVLEKEKLARTKSPAKSSIPFGPQLPDAEFVQKLLQKDKAQRALIKKHEKVAAELIDASHAYHDQAYNILYQSVAAILIAATTAFIFARKQNKDHEQAQQNLDRLEQELANLRRSLAEKEKHLATRTEEFSELTAHLKATAQEHKKELQREASAKATLSAQLAEAREHLEQARREIDQNMAAQEALRKQMRDLQATMEIFDVPLDSASNQRALSKLLEEATHRCDLLRAGRPLPRTPVSADFIRIVRPLFTSEILRALPKLCAQLYGNEHQTITQMCANALEKNTLETLDQRTLTFAINTLALQFAKTEDGVVIGSVTDYLLNISADNDKQELGIKEAITRQISAQESKEIPEIIRTLQRLEASALTPEKLQADLAELHLHEDGIGHIVTTNLTKIVARGMFVKELENAGIRGQNQAALTCKHLRMEFETTRANAELLDEKTHKIHQQKPHRHRGNHNQGAAAAASIS